MVLNPEDAHLGVLLSMRYRGLAPASLGLVAQLWYEQGKATF